MAGTVAKANRRLGRRAALVAVAGAGTAALLLSPERVPDLVAHQRGDLVFLNRSPGAPTAALDIGLDAAGRPPAAPAVTWSELGEPRGAPSLGTGATTLVAFLDYRCPACRQHAGAFLAAARERGLRLIARDWPILGAASVLAARAALAAHLQGGYWPMHEALMRTPLVPTPALIADLAEAQRLDGERLKRDMRGAAVAARLAEAQAFARGVGARGTPTYVVDGVVVGGGYRLSTLLKLAQRHRPGQAR